MSCEITDIICDKCELNFPINNYRKYSENKFGKTCKKCLNELDKTEKADKLKEKNTVYGNKNISSLIEGRQTKDLKESSSTEGAFGSKNQNVTY